MALDCFCSSRDERVHGPRCLVDVAEAYIAVVAETSFGDEVRIVGATARFGAWRPECGIKLWTTPQTYPVWVAREGDLRISTGSACDKGETCADDEFIEFKFVIAHADGSFSWESAENRRFPAVEACATLCVFRAHQDLGAMSIVSWGLAPDVRMVVWQVHCPETRPGDELVVVGSPKALGSWEAAGGHRLVTQGSIYPEWRGALLLAEPVAASFRWKLAILRGSCGHGSGASMVEEFEVGADRIVDAEGIHGKAPLLYLRATFGDVDTSFAGGVVRGSRRVDEMGAEGRWHTVPLPPPHLQSPTILANTNSNLRRTSSISTTFSRLYDEDCSEGESPSACPNAFEAVPWLWSGSYQIPKYTDAPCEDAYFCGAYGLGVADGVGSCAQLSRYGVDVAAYAGELMAIAELAIQDDEALSPSRGRVGDRAAAVLSTAEKGARAFGASTATVLVFDNTAQAGIANIGDSGFMLLRWTAPDSGAMVVAKSKEQHHGWNFPFQLTHMPPALAQRCAPGKSLDSAADCDRYEVQTQAGDLFILFTDGLSDNLHCHEILQVVDSEMAGARETGENRVPPRQLAQALALSAADRIADTECSTPFACSAKERGINDIGDGGKFDDITVVVAWVEM